MCSLPPVSPLNGHFNTISLVQLSWLEELYVSGDQNNEGAVFYPVSLTSGHFKNMFQVKPYQLKGICPRRSQQWPCHVSSPSVTNEWPAILRQSLKYNSTNSKSSIMGHMNNNCVVSSQMLPPSGLLFQDHLPNIILLTQRRSVLGDLKSNHAICIYLSRLYIFVNMYAL